ncbi:bZIP transcription factor, partial [Flavobacterium sharifuzzamanii]
LGEINAKLLQKIEELTLYMIEMKKENAEMKKENVSIKVNQLKLEEEIRNLKDR